MGMFRITPSRSAPVMRQASTGKTATERAAKEFPGETFTVAALGACELASMQNGMFLPVSARAIVVAYKARQAATRAKAARATRKAEIGRAAREAEREGVRAAEKLAQRTGAREAALKAKRLAAVPVAQALPAAPEASGELPANWDASRWDGLSAPWKTSECLLRDCQAVGEDDWDGAAPWD